MKEKEVGGRGQHIQTVSCLVSGTYMTHFYQYIHISNKHQHNIFCKVYFLSAYLQNLWFLHQMVPTQSLCLYKIHM